MNNVSYFQSVRLAFKDVTRTIDNLMDEASKHGQRDVAEAYRQSFELIRRGIEQVEKQGQSSVYKNLSMTVLLKLKIVLKSKRLLRLKVQKQAS